MKKMGVLLISALTLATFGSHASQSVSAYGSTTHRSSLLKFSILFSIDCQPCWYPVMGRAKRLYRRFL